MAINDSFLGLLSQFFSKSTWNYAIQIKRIDHPQVFEYLEIDVQLVIA